MQPTSPLFAAVVLEQRRRTYTYAQFLVTYANEFESFRRLAAAMLLSAITDAHKGKQPWADRARAWMLGARARELASVIGIRAWPPTEQQIRSADKKTLYRRIEWWPTQGWESDDLRGLSIASQKERRYRFHQPEQFLPEAQAELESL